VRIEPSWRGPEGRDYLLDQQKGILKMKTGIFPPNTDRFKWWEFLGMLRIKS
jgi:hypothetical protein